MGKNRRNKACETVKKRSKKTSEKEKKRSKKSYDKAIKREKRAREKEKKRTKKALVIATQPSIETLEPVKKPAKKLSTKSKRSRRKNDRKKHRGRDVGDEVLSSMVEIYQPNGTDWMGFKATPNNYYTFHHIKEKRFHGTRSVSNGAILTLQAHTFLNILDVGCHSAYEDYQRIFRRINEAHQAPDDDLLEDIYGMMLDVFYYNTYHIKRSVLNHFERYTYKLK